MTVSIEIPEEFARCLAPDDASLGRAALEALAAEGVRTGKLTVFQARRLLGIASRFEMDGFLKAHGVFLDIAPDDVRRDADVVIAAASR
jgi:hypothetical protein